VRIFVYCVLLSVAGVVSANTPDGKTPAVETVCDNEEGAAYGLCNAYCEAMDCTDPNQHASDKGCEAVKENFFKQTGRPMPCDVQCPCAGLLQLFADINSGAAQVQQCTLFPQEIQVLTVTGETAIVSNGASSACSVVDGDPDLVVDLTPEEALVCRVALRKAAERQGVTCIFSE